MKPDLYMFVRRTRSGEYDISSNFGRSILYIFYSKREAIKKYRKEHGLKGKHITTIDM